MCSAALLVFISLTANNSHFGSRMTFDRQGHLFFTIGERGVMVNAQDLFNPLGKVHRVNDGRWTGRVLLYFVHKYRLAGVILFGVGALASHLIYIDLGAVTTEVRPIANAKQSMKRRTSATPCARHSSSFRVRSLHPGVRREQIDRVRFTEQVGETDAPNGHNIGMLRGLQPRTPQADGTGVPGVTAGRECAPTAVCVDM